jgi:hypothetical protein
MFKLPTTALPLLRDQFLKQENGLNLVDFIISFIKLMRLQSTHELLRTVPDLIDFFDLVDINGDGGIDWSEFVMFVIDQVVTDKYSNIYEQLTLVSSRAIQPTANRQPIKCCKVIPELKRMLVGCGSEIQIYGSDDRSPTWMSDCERIPLISKINEITKRNSVSVLATVDVKREEMGAFALNGSFEKIDFLDLAYLPSRDILFVLRSDMCLEFFRLQSRTKFTAETVDHIGLFPLGKSVQ